VSTGRQNYCLWKKSGWISIWTILSVRFTGIHNHVRLPWKYVWIDNFMPLICKITYHKLERYSEDPKLLVCWKCHKFIHKPRPKDIEKSIVELL